MSIINKFHRTRVTGDNEQLAFYFHANLKLTLVLKRYVINSLGPKVPSNQSDITPTRPVIKKFSAPFNFLRFISHALIKGINPRPDTKQQRTQFTKNMLSSSSRTKHSVTNLNDKLHAETQESRSE